MVVAARKALDPIEQNPGTGSPRIGQELGIPGLRSWCVSGFPLIWFYFEREDCLDVVRLLGERQDMLSILDVPEADNLQLSAGICGESIGQALAYPAAPEQATR